MAATQDEASDAAALLMTSSNSQDEGEYSTEQNPDMHYSGDPPAQYADAPGTSSQHYPGEIETTAEHYTVNPSTIQQNLDDPVNKQYSGDPGITNQEFSGEAYALSQQQYPGDPGTSIQVLTSPETTASLTSPSSASGSYVFSPEHPYKETLQTDLHNTPVQNVPVHNVPMENIPMRTVLVENVAAQNVPCKENGILTVNGTKDIATSESCDSTMIQMKRSECFNPQPNDQEVYNPATVQTKQPDMYSPTPNLQTKQQDMYSTPHNQSEPQVIYSPPPETKTEGKYNPAIGLTHQAGKFSSQRDQNKIPDAYKSSIEQPQSYENSLVKPLHTDNPMVKSPDTYNPAVKNTPQDSHSSAVVEPQPYSPMKKPPYSPMSKTSQSKSDITMSQYFNERLKTTQSGATQQTLSLMGHLGPPIAPPPQSSPVSQAPVMQAHGSQYSADLPSKTNFTSEAPGVYRSHPYDPQGEPYPAGLCSSPFVRSPFPPYYNIATGAQIPPGAHIPPGHVPSAVHPSSGTTIAHGTPPIVAAQGALRSSHPQHQHQQL